VPGKDKAEARVAFWREKYEAKKAGKTGTDGGKPTETEKDNKPS
jgi:hypothetical protein